VNTYHFRRTFPGRYLATLGGTSITGTIVYVKEVGWFLHFTDGAYAIARTRKDAKLYAHTYLANRLR
jgi:hypothetical protein